MGLPDTLISALLGAGEGYRSGQEMRLAETLRQIQAQQEEQSWRKRQDILSGIRKTEREDTLTMGRKDEAEILLEEARAYPEIYSRALANLNLSEEDLNPMNSRRVHRFVTERARQRERRKISREQSNVIKTEDLAIMIDTSRTDEENAEETWPGFRDLPAKRKQRRLNQIRKATQLREGKEKLDTQQFNRTAELYRIRTQNTLTPEKRSAEKAYEQAFKTYKEKGDSRLLDATATALLRVDQFRKDQEDAGQADFWAGGSGENRVKEVLTIELQNAFLDMFPKETAQELFNNNFDDLQKLMDKITISYRSAVTGSAAFSGLELEDAEKIISARLENFLPLFQPLIRHAQTMAIQDVSLTHPAQLSYLMQTYRFGHTPNNPEASTIDREFNEGIGEDGDTDEVGKLFGVPVDDNIPE